MNDTANPKPRKPRFGKVPLDLAADSKVTDRAVRLYAYLAGEYGQHPEIRVPLAVISCELGWSARTARRALADLSLSGWVTVTRRRNDSSLIRLRKD